MNKWIVLFAGIILLMILGGFYAWSAFIPALVDECYLTQSQCGFVLGSMIAVFAVTMVPAGHVFQRFGARLTALTGALLFSAGYLLASYSGGRYAVLLPGLGVVTGMGIGFGYVCPLTLGMRWFPSHKGLVTGISLAGFGSGAILLSLLAEYLMRVKGMAVLEVFRFIGIVPGSVALVSALFLCEPSDTHTVSVERAPYQIWRYLATRWFIVLSLGMFAGTFGGLMIIGNLKPMMLRSGLSESSATLSISMFAAGNIAGRVVWGKLHDLLGSRVTILASLSYLALALLLFFVTGLPSWGLLLATLLVGVGFGGCFVVYASSMVEIYGFTLFPRLYPFCFVAYGIGALVSPTLGGWLADHTGTYVSGVALSFALIFLAVATIWISTRSSHHESST